MNIYTKCFISLGVLGISLGGCFGLSMDNEKQLLDKVDISINRICKTSKHSLINPMIDKIDKIITSNKFEKYTPLLQSIKATIEKIAPGCYDPQFSYQKISTLTIITTQAIESLYANLSERKSYEQGLSSVSEFPRFYHVYYSWATTTPINPVILFHIPPQSGCLKHVRGLNEYADVYYSINNGNSWEKWIINQKSCPQATQVKIIPSKIVGNITVTANANMISLHLVSPQLVNKDLCIDITYSADNAQYIENKICEKSDSSMTYTDTSGTTQSVGSDIGSKTHKDFREKYYNKS